MQFRTVARIASLLCAAFATGCGIASTDEGITWQARLDSMPSIECVHDAIIGTDGVRLADYKHYEQAHSSGPPDRTDGFLINIKSLPFGWTMGVGIVQSHRQPVLFRLDYKNWEQYDDWKKYGDVYTSTAKALIARISASCGVPELALRARQTRSVHWTPYLFNV